MPIDRYYIEGFLARHASDVRGRVLEFGNDAYTRRFGGDRVAATDVFDVHSGDEWGACWYWRFTPLSVRRLFEEPFPTGGLEIHPHGNVLVATAFLHGLATRELGRNELDDYDPLYDVLITIRATKGGAVP